MKSAYGLKIPEADPQLTHVGPGTPSDRPRPIRPVSRCSRRVQLSSHSCPGYLCSMSGRYLEGTVGTDAARGAAPSE